jgi:hypothetical protein
MKPNTDIFRNIILCLLIMAPCPAFAVSNSFAPPSGETLLLVGQDRNSISRYVRATGSIPGGTMLYTSIQEMKGLEESCEYGSGPQYGKSLLRSYPHSVIQVGLYMVGGLSNTLAGTYDVHLLSLAQWIKKANRPVYLRIGYEFDNPLNHYAPELYVEAYRYVVDFLRKEGVRNAAYVWHSYCVENPGQQWMDWYPGDDYVDWFGVSIFSTSQLWSASSFLKLAREHHKPFMIAESTPCGMYIMRGKVDWFNHIFHFIEDNSVEAFCYIDCNWDTMPMFQGQHWGDARIEDYRETKDLWLKEIHQDRYLKSSPHLFQSLGWIH